VLCLANASRPGAFETRLHPDARTELGGGLWAMSALTLMNARSAGRHGNAMTAIIRTSVRIPKEREELD